MLSAYFHGRKKKVFDSQWTNLRIHCARLQIERFCVHKFHSFTIAVSNVHLSQHHLSKCPCWTGRRAQTLHLGRGIGWLILHMIWSRRKSMEKLVLRRRQKKLAKTPDQSSGLVQTQKYVFFWRAFWKSTSSIEIYDDFNPYVEQSSNNTPVEGFALRRFFPNTDHFRKVVFCPLPPCGPKKWGLPFMLNRQFVKTKVKMERVFVHARKN